MDRKLFLKTAAFSAFSISTFGKIIRGKDGRFIGDCETTNDILGPFYRENAPEKSDLTFAGLTGNMIYLNGKVMASDCKQAVKDACIEIWHCDTLGEYDHSSPQFKHRGLQKSNENGAYEFKTIMPGKYLNGSLYRPSHIHFRITHPEYQELISQIYFKGDPHILTDPWASDAASIERILPVFPENTDGSLTVQFNIYLREKK